MASMPHYQRPDQPYNVLLQTPLPGPSGDNRTSISKALSDPIFRPDKRKWGFVIVRGTYGDGDAWQAAMTKISSLVPVGVEAIEEQQNAVELYDQTVLEDPEAFTDATKDSLRPHFTKWVHADLASAIDMQVLRERYPDPILNMPSPIRITDSFFTKELLHSTRHAYFVYINTRCLQSFTTANPVVILVQKDYDTSSGVDSDEDDDNDPIEGNPRWDVGWYYMALSCYVERYRDLGDPMSEDWERFYERPPWVSDDSYCDQDVPFGPELNRDGTEPASRWH